MISEQKFIEEVSQLLGFESYPAPMHVKQCIESYARQGLTTHQAYELVKKRLDL